MRIEAPDDEVAKSERFFDCASRPEIGERSPEEQMSGRCAQNDEASQECAWAGGSSAKCRAAVAMKLLVTAEKLERDPSRVMCFFYRRKIRRDPSLTMFARDDDADRIVT